VDFSDLSNSIKCVESFSASNLWGGTRVGRSGASFVYAVLVLQFQSYSMEQWSVWRIFYLDPRCSVKEWKYTDNWVCKRRAVSADAGYNAWWTWQNQGPVVIRSCKVDIYNVSRKKGPRVFWLNLDKFRQLFIIFGRTHSRWLKKCTKSRQYLLDNTWW